MHRYLGCIMSSVTLNPQAYTSKRHILIQVLPVPNRDLTVLDTALGYIRYITRFGICIWDRKYLNEYTPFGSVSL